MACRESRGSRILLCLGLLVVASSFCCCTRLTKLKALDKLKGNSMHSRGQAEGRDLRHGRLLIGQNSLQGGELRGTKATKNFLDVDTDYQADMGWGEPKQPQPQGDVFSRPNTKPDSAAVERLLKMDPKVECTGDSMKLQVQDAASTPGSLFFVDRGSRLSPLPLSKLPPSCGYTIRSTMRDLVLVAPYDGCFVALEEDCYVLPLRWCGLPVRMSCPVMKQSSPNPPMVTCHAQGMIVKTGWTVSVSKINVNLTGNWEPLMKASPRCGFSVVVHPEGVVISVRYAPCLQKKDGMYTLQLAGEGETKISCPSLSPTQTVHTKPTNGPTLQTETPRKEGFPSTPSPINHTQAAVPQVPNFPKNLEVPKKISNLLPYYPYFFYPYPANPDTKPTTTVQPSQKTVPTKQSPTSPPQVVQAANGNRPQHYYPFPWHPLPSKPPSRPPLKPVKPPASKPEQLVPPKPPAFEEPWGQVQQPFHPFYTHPEPEKPSAVPRPPQPEAPQPEPEKPTAVPRPLQPVAPWGHIQQPFYPFHFYPQPERPTAAPRPTQSEAPQPEPEKPTAAPRPLQPIAPWGHVQQPFYPFHFYPQPERPSAAPKPPQPETPQPELEKPTAPARLPQPETPKPEPEKPNAAPRPLQPVAHWGHVQQPFYPFHFYPQPERPTAAPRPTQPETPQPEPEKPSVAPKPPQPESPQPEPEKPIAAPRPPQPVAPWGHVQQPFYPFHFYPQPERPTAAPRPTQPETPQPEPEKPSVAPKPPQPEAPQPEPEKPIAAPRPPQPVAPWGHVQQPFYPFHFYPQPERPTAASRPAQPETPQPEPEKTTAAVRPPQPEMPQPEPEKPIAAPRPPQPVAPWGHVQQPFYPFHFYPQPERPTAAPRPPQPETPQPEPEKTTAAVRPPQPEMPQPEPEKPIAAPRPPQPVAPWGHVQQPFYPFHFYPQPEKPTAAPRPPQPETPQPESEKPTAPARPPQPETPQPEPEKPIAAPRPPQPVAPWGHVQQPFYPFHFYPQPERPTAGPRPPQPETPQPEPEKTTAAVRPPQPEAPKPEPERPTAAQRPPQPVAHWGHVQQPFYPFHFYPQPEKPTAAPRPPQPEAPQPEPEKPTVAPRPPQPVAPWGHVQQPFHLYYQPEPEKPTAVPRPPATTEKPVQSEQLPPVRPPEDQIYRPQHPQPVTLPPAMQQPQIITHVSDQNSAQSLSQPSNGGIVPQPPQLGSPYMPSVYCPQVCPSGFSNCCPQIAFHQHLHQIIPAGLGSQDAPFLNPGLPFLPSAYSGYGNSLGSAPLPQKPTEATAQPTTMSTSAPISSQPLPSGNKWPHLQPPDGTLAVLLRNPSKSANPEQPTYPYIVPNSLYSNWLYLPQNEDLQNLAQSQSPAHHNVPSKPQASGNEPVNPVLQYEPYNVQPWKQQNVHLSAEDLNNPSGPNFVSHISQYLQQQHIAKLQSVPTAKDLQPSNNKANDFEGQMQPEVQSELDRFLVPYYMLQDGQVQTHDKSMAPNNASQLQQFVSGRSTNHDLTVHSYSEPKNYVLLQHGPPGREPNSFSESPLPFRDLIRDPNFFAQNFEKHHSSKFQPPQSLIPPQEKPQHPKWLGKGMSYSLPDVNYMPRPGDKIRRSING